jgi:aspartyl/asparaginyl beta-hydroxylase (cupin superfamily)
MQVSLPRREDVEASLAARDLPRALAASTALLDSDPGNTGYRVLHATVLMSGGQWQPAAELLEGPATAPSASYGAMAKLAICRAALGEHRAAAGMFEAALADRPGEFPLRLAFAESLDAAGDAAAALPEYFRALHDAQARGRWLDDASTPPLLRERVKQAMQIVDRGRSALFAQVMQPHVAAFGRDSLARVGEALELYLGTRIPPEQDPRQKPKFFWVPGLPATPYFDRGLFDWYHALEGAADAIRGELREVLARERELTPFLVIDDKAAEEAYLAGNPDSRAWDAFFFHRHGERFDAHLRDCPRTAAALDAVPLTRIDAHAPEVLFSVLAAQTHIKPHHGVTNTRVVTHLPLLIPEGDCKLVVGGIEHAWQPGRCITFDDTFLHEAWNRSDQTRVVLILDTWNPYLSAEECIVMKDLIEQIGAFNMRAGIR